MGLISYDTDVHMSHERPADKEGDWDVDDESVKLTPLQRVAKWSKGWLTAANIVSIGAAGLTAKGIVDVAHGDAVRGVVEIGAGRVGDLVDGAVALWTKTRGKIGALVDSGLDKLLSGFGLYELTAVSHNIPLWMAAPIALQQGTIIALNKIIHNRGGSPTPNKAGKWGMAALWGYFGAVVFYQAMQALHWSHEEVASAIGYLSGLGAVGLSGVAIYDYSMQSKLLKKPAESAELPN
jgi:phosphatidylglycerophosphate synthase